MSFKYEPSSEPLHMSAKKSFLNSGGYREWVLLGVVVVLLLILDRQRVVCLLVSLHWPCDKTVNS
jgi:hypothetical protein